MCIMNKFRRILVPIDGSKNAFRGLNHAIDLAKISGAKIIGTYISYIPGNLSNPRQGFINQTLTKEAKEYLNTAKKQCDKNNVDFVSKILPGTPSNGIVNFAQNIRNGIDLIVMGSRGLTGPKEKFLGSVSNHVIHKSKIPVMIIK